MQSLVANAREIDKAKANHTKTYKQGRKEIKSTINKP
jgi:hypothetical protein